MRVAALNDIHGNLPALEAVLAEVEQENVDAISQLFEDQRSAPSGA